jgi:putative transcriptional regulator
MPQYGAIINKKDPIRGKLGRRMNMREKLCDLRKTLGYTQKSFALKINISRSHYSQIEIGTKEPSLKVGLLIKKTLNYKNDDIFLNTNDAKRGIAILEGLVKKHMEI